MEEGGEGGGEREEGMEQGGRGRRGEEGGGGEKKRRVTHQSDIPVGTDLTNSPTRQE